MMRSTLSSLTKQTMGRVRRRTSTKQRSMTLVCAQFAPQVRRHLKKGQQLGQVLFELAHQSGISFLPVRLEGAKRPDGGSVIGSQIDGLRAVFHGGKIAAAHVLEKIAHLVDPATLMPHAWIDGLNGGG